MTQTKKFAWSGLLVAFAFVAAASLLVQTAQAATTGGTTQLVTVPVATAAAAPGNNTFTTLSPIVLTCGANGDINTGADILLELEVAQGWAFGGVAPTVAATGAAVATSPGVLTDADTITVTVTTDCAAGDTVTITGVQVQPLAITAIADATVTAVTAGGSPIVARVSPDTVATGWVSLNAIADVPGSGASNTAVRGVVGVGTGAGAVVQGSKQVTLTSSIAGFGTTGASSTTVFSDASGVITSTYRGTGTTGTDSVTATTPAPNSGVGSTQVTLTAAAAGTPSALAHVNNFAAAGAGTLSSNVAPNNSGVNPNYTSAQTGTNVVFRVTDASGSGVNGQVLQVTTDKGGLVAFEGTCSTTAPKAITVTTAATFGGSASTTAPGRGGVRFCAGTGEANRGAATITATNISTTMATATATVTTAGVPATITTNWNNGSLEVTVTDADGNPVADGTEVTVTIASTVGSVAPATRATVAGKATFAVALTGSTGNAIVSVNDTAGGTNRLTQSVNVTATTPTPGTGDGSLTTPSFGTGNVGSAVFAGGTIEQLAAQVTAAGGTSVWAQDPDTGNWVRYNTLATGATAFVNNAFNAAFADGFAGATAVFVVK